MPSATSRLASSATWAAHHTDTSRSPASTSSRNELHGTHSRSATSDGSGVASLVAIAVKTGQSSFSRTPLAIVAS